MKSFFLKPFIFVLILHLTFNFAAHAQSRLNTSISGKVYDKSTGEPLEYSTITVISKLSGKTVTGTVADIKGSFALSNIPFDTYQINIEFIGYEKVTLDNIVINSE